MYIQTPSSDDRSFSLPQGYSGSAFSPMPPTIPQEIAEPEAAAVHETPTPREAPPALPEEMPPQPEATPAWSAAQHREGGALGGLLGKIPFLGNLLPPPRPKSGGREPLPEWLTIVILLYLLTDNKDGDLLPFLLLLLLWD